MRIVILVCSLALLATACFGDDWPDPTLVADPITVSEAGSDAPSEPSADLTVADGATCRVLLHGKGGNGGATIVDGDGISVVQPTGPASGWGGRQWLYGTDADYQAGVEAISASLDEAGCGRTIIRGFSNGAAMAAAALCAGERFDDRVVGYVVDDPVADSAVDGCAPADGVAVALYWTGDLSFAVAGTDCRPLGWTCSEGQIVGIDAYAAAIGTEIKDSKHGNHQPYNDAPELTAWLS